MNMPRHAVLFLIFTTLLNLPLSDSVLGRSQPGDAEDYRDLRHTTSTERGQIGPSVPLREILSRSTDQLEDFFRGTVLDRSWIPVETIRRNALLSGAYRPDPAVDRLMDAYRGSPRRFLYDAAVWSLENRGKM